MQSHSKVQGLIRINIDPPIGFASGIGKDHTAVVIRLVVVEVVVVVDPGELQDFLGQSLQRGRFSFLLWIRHFIQVDGSNDGLTCRGRNHCQKSEHQLLP